MILTWVGIYLAFLLLVFQGSLVISSWVFRLLGLPEQGWVYNAIGMVIVVGSPIGAGLLTWTTYRYFARAPQPWPESETEPGFRSPGEDERDAARAARIGRITAIGTGLGAVLGLGLALALVVFSKPGETGLKLRPLIMAPFTMGGAGFFLSLAAACLLAPSTFLTGPYGQPFLQKIGTRNVMVARIVCLLVGLVIGGPLLGLTFLAFLAIWE